MKKYLSLLAAIALVTTTLLAEDDYPKISVGGRVLMEMVSENNMDFTDFDDTTEEGNDAKLFGHGRVDVKFKAELNKNIMGFVNTRFEGKGTGDKWMNFGKDKTGDGDQFDDAWFALQEAYLQYKNLLNLPITLNMGRKDWNYGNSNILYKKLDGMMLGYNNQNIFVNYHFIVKDNGVPFDTAEGDNSNFIWGLYGGMEKLADVVNVDAYFLRSAKKAIDAADSKEAVVDAKMVFGAKFDASLMDGMISPYLEFATQTGSNGQDGDDEMKYSGMLVDLGINFETEVNDKKLDAMVEFFMASGDDADTADENELFGLGIADREEGYNVLTVANNGYQMIKVGAGYTPIKNLRTGFNFWMFNDNSKNIDKASGENIYNEFSLDVTYKMYKNTKIYAGMAMLMPNKDYTGDYLENADLNNGEDSGMALYFGTEVKW
ncbi:MAG: hypothetical protein PHR06_08665 [Candidatus Cloacimonetes bacterium]|nr:hypothetical protein [Candidatus Cloacimonadota bacterium]